MFENHYSFIDAMNVHFQEGQLGKLCNGSSLRRFLGSPEAPVVVVRGNHDYVDIGPYFGGEYFEIDDDCTRTVEYCGLKFGGLRGITYIGGNWQDEYQPNELEGILSYLPYGVDVLVSHAPPAGIMDNTFGVAAYASYINIGMYGTSCPLPKVFCFGHIHECGPVTREEDDGTVYSNAARGVNSIEV
jgi:Icc-related predicted phosphoesterase